MTWLPIESAPKDGTAAMKIARTYDDGSGVRIAVSFDQLRGYTQGNMLIECHNDILIPFDDLEWFCEAVLSIRSKLIAEGYLAPNPPPVSRD